MKRAIIVTLLISVFVAASFSVGFAADNGRTYAVTITNITRGQVISPPVVFSHKEGFHLFDLGTPASDALAQLAEDAATDVLEAELLSSGAVHDVVVAAGPIPPGASVTVEVNARGAYFFVSAAGMLVTTNDAFFAVRNLRLPWWKGTQSAEAEAYDAGSETNTELCESIPGPPCGSAGVRDTGGAEGYVHVHAGIHGVGDLAPEAFDWRNPVAHVEISRVR